MEERYGVLLPGSELDQSGNYDEFADIRAQLRQRDVRWYERVVGAGNSTIFWLFASELPKLPQDRTTMRPGGIPQYLPVDDVSGHTISRMDTMLEHKQQQGEDVFCPE